MSQGAEGSRQDLPWRRNLQKDVDKNSVENPDFLNMVDFGFWLFATRQGSYSLL